MKKRVSKELEKSYMAIINRELRLNRNIEAIASRLGISVAYAMELRKKLNELEFKPRMVDLTLSDVDRLRHVARTVLAKTRVKVRQEKERIKMLKENSIVDYAFFMPIRAQEEKRFEEIKAKVLADEYLLKDYCTACKVECVEVTDIEVAKSLVETKETKMRYNDSWTVEKEEFLKQNYATMETRELMQKLGVTRGKLRYRAFALNLKKLC